MSSSRMIAKSWTLPGTEFDFDLFAFASVSDDNDLDFLLARRWRTATGVFFFLF